MYCPKCGAKVDDDYNFCPVCGFKLVKQGRPAPMRFRRPGVRVKDPFEDIFGGGPFGDFDSFFKSSFLGFPGLRKRLGKSKSSKGGGFSVKIVRGTGKEPKISVKTFGDLKGKENEVRRRVGLEEKEERPKIEEVEPREFEKTEEPECEVKKEGDTTVVEVELPDVESMADVDVAVYRESLEIRAYAEDTAFFRIVKIPKGAELVDKCLEDGKLILKLR